MKKQVNGKQPESQPARQYTTEASYMRELLEACPMEEWRAILRRAVEDAKGGDAKARAFLASYLLKEAPTFVEMAAQQEAAYDPVDSRARALESDKFMDDISRIPLIRAIG